jgi:hypothetical protein
MAFKIGSTVVIDNSGNIDWSRLVNVPTIGDITSVGVSNATPSGGVAVPSTSGAGSITNCNCATNCYVTSLSGGGSAGAVTITASRSTFNCNCNCICRC